MLALQYTQHGPYCLNFCRLYIRFQALIIFWRTCLSLGVLTRVEGALMDLHEPVKGAYNRYFMDHWLLEKWIDVFVLDFTKKGGYKLKGIWTCDPSGGTSSPKVLSYTRCLKVWPGVPGAPKLLSHVSFYAQWAELSCNSSITMVFWLNLISDQPCLERRKLHSFPCQKYWKSRIICYAKMSKITLFLWKDFGLNFTLAEGLWSIPCLYLSWFNHGGPTKFKNIFFQQAKLRFLKRFQNFQNNLRGRVKKLGASYFEF